LALQPRANLERQAVFTVAGSARSTEFLQTESQSMVGTQKVSVEADYCRLLTGRFAHSKAKTMGQLASGEEISFGSSVAFNAAMQSAMSKYLH
jgi:hypothetical protein